MPDQILYTVMYLVVAPEGTFNVKQAEDIADEIVDHLVVIEGDLENRLANIDKRLQLCDGLARARPPGYAGSW